MDIAELGFVADSSSLKDAVTNLDKVSGAAKRTETATERMERQWQSMAKQMKKLFSDFATDVVKTLAAVAAFETVRRVFQSSIAAARAYGKAIAEVGTLLSDTRGLRAQSLALRELAKRYGTDGVAQVSAYYEAVSAGAKAGAQALGLVAVANRAAIGSVAETKTVVDILTTATNAYAASNLTAADAADTLFIGVAAGKTSFTELADSMGRLIPTATAANLSFDSMVAAVAALTLQGQDTKLAVTGMSAAIASIITPTKQAADMAKTLGLEFNLAALESKGFQGFLQDVVQKSKGSKEALAILFGSMEASRAVFSLAGEGGVAFNQIMQQMESRAGATDAAFVKMTNTADFQMKRLGASVSDAMVTAGDAILQVLGPAAAVLADNLEEIISAGTTLAMVIGTVLVARAGAALLAWLAKTAVAWATNALLALEYSITIGALAGTSMTAAGATAALGGALALVGGPLGAALLAVGALSYSIYSSIKASEARRAEERQAITSLGEYVANMRKAREEKELLARAEASGNGAEQQSAVERLTQAKMQLMSIERQLDQAVAFSMARISGYAQLVTELRERQASLRGEISEAEQHFIDLGTEAQRAGEGMKVFTASLKPFADLPVISNLSRMVELVRGVAPVAEEAEEGMGGLTDAATEYAASIQETTVNLQMQLIELTKGREAALQFEAAQKLGLAGTQQLSAGLLKQIAAIVSLEGKIASITKKREFEKQAIEDCDAATKEYLQAREEEAKQSRESYQTAIKMIEAIDEQAKRIGLTQEAVQRLNDEKAISAELDKAALTQSPEMVDALRKRMKAALDAHEAMELTNAAAEELNQILSQSARDMGFDQLVSDIEKVGEALRAALDRGEDVSRLREALGGLRHELAVGMVGSAQQVLSSVQSMSKEGSKAYKAMEVAGHALNVVLAISAILNQGKGDPWTAFARMAAMAVAVAGLVGSVGSFGGGGGPSADSAEVRQELQGTGTVLGDADAKSQSIQNALDITADATSQLVGLNRGMLIALQAMQSGISGAAASISRLEFSQPALASAMGPLLDPGGNTIAGRIFGAIFGGGQDLIDQGIRIQGGAFGGVSSNPNASSYQTIETDGGWFGSDRTNDEFDTLSQSATTQIRLILESIGDAVREGAIALGMDAEAVNAAIEAFRIEEIRISTMDLTGEEAQEQLAAAFSAIFDGLAGEVVPFIEQFQRVGEGLGETLIRVATGVQVTQEALLRLGFSLEETGPEAFAQISESLIELAGGIEEFINGMSTFIDKFAPPAHKFELLQSDLTRALEQVGLTVPTTREAMWELMQSLDATTESGREQIATLLRLAGVSDAYYAQLDRVASDLAELMAGVDNAMAPVLEDGVPYWVAAMEKLVAENDALIARAIELGASEEELARVRAFAQQRVDELTASELAHIAQLEAAQAAAATSLDRLLTVLSQGEWGSPIQSLIDLDAQYREHVQTIQQLARESGRVEASQAELLMATRWYQRQLAKLAGEIMQSAVGILGQLGYQGYSDPTIGTELGGIDQVNTAVEDRYARELQLLQQLDEFVRSLNLSAISPLTPGERLADAQREYERLLALAQGGDLDALAQLQGAAQAYLQEASGYFGGVGEFPTIFAGVRDALAALVAAGPQSAQLGPTTPVIGGPVLVNPGDGFAAMNATERALLTQQLVDHLAALSIALNTPILQLMDEMNIPLQQLATDLGADLTLLTGESVRVLAALAHDLGLPLGQMVQELGLNLPDLAAGIRELAEDMDINLSALTAETAMQLAGLAGALSTDLAVLTESLGIDLGRLTDINSPIFQALQQTIDTLSPEIRAQLAPLLSGITGAVSDADATAAVQATEAAINAMPVGIRDLLAPFFAGVFPAGALTELNYLGSIDMAMFTLSGTAGRSEGLLMQILQNIQEQNRAMELPAYAQGTPFVPSTGPAMLHAGEMVIPRAIANRIRNGGDDPGQPSDRASYAELVAEVKALRNDLSPKLSAVVVNTGVVATDINTLKPQSRGRPQ
jgi:TP901 family phage tail tape measure protein